MASVASLVQSFAFYLFAGMAVLGAVLVVAARNPVHSVLSLVLTFFSTAGLFVLLGAEFMAAVLVMVYMGAVAMLFLFVVMLLDVDFDTLRQGAADHLPMGLAVGFAILVELVVIMAGIHPGEGAAHAAAVPVSNTMAIGKVLYTQYLYPFEAASLILLVAMIGAIGLTQRVRRDIRRQKVCEQIARRRDEAVELKEVAPGQGA
ncbi:MAG: NADH-quinone oxidoreductase subunit J [Magnetococcales bacterium]|nr:NADH-quinone oxidoreductase subunit J [Magnetococcales bacterium]